MECKITYEELESILDDFLDKLMDNGVDIDCLNENNFDSAVDKIWNKYFKGDLAV